MTQPKPRLLILSFSDIANDARVMKQVRLFADSFQVTTCGFGEQPDPRVRHLSYVSAGSQRRERIQAVFRRLKWYEVVRRLEPFVGGAERALRGEHFDAVLVNDPEGVKIAFELVSPDRVHVDLHEFYPGLHDHLSEWVTLKRPYYEWMLGQVRRAASATTVSKQIAQRYQDEYQISCGVVHNALPYQQLTPGLTGDPIRIVHSGSAQADRRIEVMMEAVARSSANITLDLYLTAERSAYAQSLRELADQLGDRINVHPPRPYSELLATINQFDIGIHILPPINTNNRLALPNKLFDYVQARLGVIVGPTEAMAEPVAEFGIGAVTEGFDVESVVRTLNTVAQAQTEAWKQHADAAAEQLSVDAQLPVWDAAVNALVK